MTLTEAELAEYVTGLQCEADCGIEHCITRRRAEYVLGLIASAQLANEQAERIQMLDGLLLKTIADAEEQAKKLVEAREPTGRHLNARPRAG